MEKSLKLKMRKPASLEKRKAMSGYVFVLPFILGIILIYLPILIDSVWLSFFERVTDPVKKWAYEFRGLTYYKSVLTGSIATNFISKLMSGLQQLIFEVPAVIIFSLFIAVVLNQKMLGRAAFRAIFFVPVIISTGLMESINGTALANQMSEGIDDGSGEGGIINIMQVEELFREMAVGGELVAYVVNLVNDIYKIINYSGVQMLIFLAGLQSISESIYEACRIDGATGWETFWKVTFPMISPMILVNAVYTVIDSFTRSTNITMSWISTHSNTHEASAMYWIYFLSVILIIAVVAGVASTFIFYQRKD